MICDNTAGLHFPSSNWRCVAQAVAGKWNLELYIVVEAVQHYIVYGCLGSLVRFPARFDSEVRYASELNVSMEIFRAAPNFQYYNQ